MSYHPVKSYQAAAAGHDMKMGLGDLQDHPIPRESARLTPLLEQELYSKLSASRVVFLIRSRDFSKIRGRRSCNRVREVSLVKGIEEFSSQLNPHAFPDLEVLQKRQVNVIDGVPADVAKAIRQRAQVVERRRVG